MFGYIENGVDAGFNGREAPPIHLFVTDGSQSRRSSGTRGGDNV